MAPRNRKRTSDQSIASEPHHTPVMANQKIATKTGSPTENPSKKRKMGITMNQKQALMDNLQLEVTERARKLRAQYNLQAQGLRTRIEIRVNRIPMALRKLKMGELLLKHAAGPLKSLPGRQTAAATTSRTVAAVAEKDYHATRPPTRGQSPTRTVLAASRPHKRNSDDMAGDKENQVAHDGTKKRSRLQQQASGTLAASTGVPAHAPLSPASSNSRLNPRDRPPTATSTTTATATAIAPPMSPVKPFVARPPSPEKQAAATNLLSAMVEKARSTRAGGGRKPMGASTTSAASTSTTRSKKGTTTTSASRTARRASGTSESSEGSTSTVVRKTGRGRATGATTAATAKKATGTAATTGSTRKTVMSSIKKGVANAATKRGAAKAAAAAGTTGTATSTRSGRILRKRE